MASSDAGTLQFSAAQTAAVSASASASLSSSSAAPLNSSGHLKFSLSSARFRPLVHSLSSSAIDFSPEFHSAVCALADEFVESLANFGCALARLRNSSVLQPRDLQLAAETRFGLQIPIAIQPANSAGDSGHLKEAKSKRIEIAESHKRRIQAIQQIRKVQIQSQYQNQKQLMKNNQSEPAESNKRRKIDSNTEEKEEFRYEKNNNNNRAN